MGEPTASAPRALPATPVGRLLRERRADILQMVERHGAGNIRLFRERGARDDSPESDIDLMIDLAPGTGLFGLMALRPELTKVLGRQVDLVPAAGLEPHLAARVEQDQIPL